MRGNSYTVHWRRKFLPAKVLNRRIFPKYMKLQSSSLLVTYISALLSMRVCWCVCVLYKLLTFVSCVLAFTYLCKYVCVEEYVFVCVRICLFAGNAMQMLCKKLTATEATHSPIQILFIYSVFLQLSKF